MVVAGVLVDGLWFERLEKKDEAPKGKVEN
jgi:hypothetical protein